MSKVRINDLARELEVKSKAILDVLPKVGVTEKKTHSSSIEVDEAERVRKHFAGQGGAAARDGGSRAAESAIKTKIDLSHISRPGDVLKAITQKKEAVAAPPPARPAAPPVAAKPAVAPPAKPAAPAPVAAPTPTATPAPPAPAARVVVPVPVERPVHTVPAPAPPAAVLVRHSPFRALRRKFQKPVFPNPKLRLRRALLLPAKLQLRVQRP